MDIMAVRYIDVGLLILLSILSLVKIGRGEECLQGVNCYLPNCFCPTFDHPLGSDNIPQIVYFGFDDAVQQMVAKYYDDLFTSSRRNPNGCPITMTLYISDQYTSYDLVARYYKKGDEMGVHSVTHKDIDNPTKLLEEAAEQKLNIEQKSDVPARDIVGWRSPNLKTAGDDQPRVLKQLNYTYDNSLSYNRDLKYPFPFTLDYGYPYPCTIPPCPRFDSKHKGFWEVMIHSFTDPSTGLPCGYVDGCRPETEDDAEEYLWSNFLYAYETNKAPFGLNMHAAWFAFPGYLPAMAKFVDRILALPDVYIISVGQMMKWMKSPVPLSEIKTFEPWGCNTGTVKRSSDNWPSKNHAPKVAIPPRMNSYVQRYIRNTTRSIPVHKPTMKTTTMPQIVTQQSFRREEPMKSNDFELSTCVQGNNCHLPQCLCKASNPPIGLSATSRNPQIVFLVIDTPIDGRTYEPLTQIFWPPRRGENGCQVSGSIFIPTSGNYLPYAKMLAEMGAKIGLRLDRTINTRSLATDISQTKMSLNALYGIRGVGIEDQQLSEAIDIYQSTDKYKKTFIVKESYDSSWPYTLDFGNSNKTQCSRDSGCYPGVWQVPISPIRIPGQVRPCLHPNMCPFLFRNAADTFSILKYNFYRHYFSTRAPFGISIDQNWLNGHNGQERIKGLNQFIDFLLENREVAMVSVDKIVEWISKAGQPENYLYC